MSPTRPRRLARLDSAVVPRLAGVLHGVATTGRWVVGLTGSPGRAVGRLARRNATITAAALVVAVAATLVLTTGVDRRPAVAPPPPSPTVTLPGNVLGPTPGQPVSTYLVAAAQRRSLLPKEAATAKVVTVVDFTSYLTPAAVASVLQGLPEVQATTAFAQPPPPASDPIHTITLQSGSSLASLLAAQQSQARDFLTNYNKLVKVAAVTPTAKLLGLVRAYTPQVREAKDDVAGIGADVGCVFAIEVTGPPAQLSLLAQREDVRVLDPAPTAVATADLRIQPLEPQVTGLVQPLEFAGG